MGKTSKMLQAKTLTLSLHREIILAKISVGFYGGQVLKIELLHSPPPPPPCPAKSGSTLLSQLAKGKLILLFKEAEGCSWRCHLADGMSIHRWCRENHPFPYKEDTPKKLLCQKHVVGGPLNVWAPSNEATPMSHFSPSAWVG